MKCVILPIVDNDVWEQAGKDAEVADGKHVDVDHMAQTVSNCNTKTSDKTYEKSNNTMTQKPAIHPLIHIFTGKLENAA